MPKNYTAALGALLGQLRAAVVGLLEIEDVRISTGAFKPNPEAQRRIDAARAALEALETRWAELFDPRDDV